MKIEGTQSEIFYNLRTQNSSLNLNYQSQLHLKSIRGIVQFLYRNFTAGITCKNKADFYQIRADSNLSKIFEEKSESDFVIPGVGYYMHTFNFALFHGNISPEYTIYSLGGIDEKYSFKDIKAFVLFSFTKYFGREQTLNLILRFLNLCGLYFLCFYSFGIQNQSNENQQDRVVCLIYWRSSTILFNSAKKSFL